MKPRSIEPEVLETCPSCGETLRRGIRERHSIGPGHAARVVQFVTIAFAILAIFVGVKAWGGNGWGLGYVVFLPPIIIGAGGYWLASLLPRSRRARCRACGWQAEVPCS